MKKIIFILALAIPLMAGIIFTGYRLSTQKQKAAQTKVPYANRDLIPTPKVANTVAEKPINAEEWMTFKSESERKIRNLEIRIAELNIEIKNQGEKSDVLYRKKIANLEQQNKFMKAMLENFEKGPSNWESFNHGFNRDMDAIENALKDLTADNKK
jgi:lipopolysaccharide export LptBFGC system permease protein LptF